MKRFEPKTLLILLLPALGILIFTSLLSSGLFKPRASYRVVKNQLGFYTIMRRNSPDKAIHEAVFEFRKSSWADTLLRREKKIESQTSDFTCVDSKTGKGFPPISGGAMATDEGERDYALYRRQDLQKVKGDLKLKITLGFLEGGQPKRVIINKQISHGELQQMLRK